MNATRRRKNRVKGKQALKRRSPAREPYDVVLIVCEGTKTEPAYLRDLRNQYRLNTANVEIVPGGYGTDPESVVQFAIDKFNERKEADHVFCVIDRDEHLNLEPALARVSSTRLTKNNRKQATLDAIISTPCFEVWLLLHFRYSTAPYERTGRNSPCANVLSELQCHLTDYSKGMQGVFSALMPKLATALRNAQALRHHNEETQTTNPATCIDRLVIYLKDLKEPKR